MFSYKILAKVVSLFCASIFAFTLFLVLSLLPRSTMVKSWMDECLCQVVSPTLQMMFQYTQTWWFILYIILFCSVALLPDKNSNLTCIQRKNWVYFLLLGIIIMEWDAYYDLNSHYELERIDLLPSIKF